MNNKYIILFILLFTYTFAGWEPQISGTNVSLNDVYFPNDTLTGYICGDSGIILKTTNSGNDWIRQNTPVTTQLNAIYFIGDSGWCVGNSKTMLMTTDGGLNWLGNSGGTGNWYDVWYFNSNVGLVIGNNGTIVKTTDGGRTWQLITIGNTVLRSIFFINNSIGWIVGSNSTCFKTTDCGYTWDSILTNPSGIFWDIYFIDELTGYITCDHGKVQKTTDGGEVWELFTVAPVTINLHSIDFEDNETGYICGDSGFVCKLYGQYTIINSSIDLYSINFPAQNVGWTVGSHGSIYKTSDGMAVAEKINKKDVSLISCSPNPFTDYMTIKIPTQIKTTLKIYDKTGNLINEEKIANGRYTLNSRFLAKGIYFIKVNGLITKVIKI